MLIALFAAVGTVQAQNEFSRDTVAEITFDKVIHDYGNIFKGDNGVCEFAFTNTGGQPLVLTNCRSSCGCTVPEWPKEAIAPGASAVIKVKYNTQRIGTISKTVTVESNAINNRVILKIKGSVADIPQEAVPENNNTMMLSPAPTPASK